MNPAKDWRCHLEALEQLPELRSYQDAPAQMAAGAPGKRGHLGLGFEMRRGRSVLSHLQRQSPLLVQQALYWDEAMPQLPICTVLSVGGGTLQGDRLSIDVDVADGACAHVTTQGATRVHTMDANCALQAVNLSVGAAAYLEYLPDVLIPYRGSRYASQTHICLHPEGSLLLSEVVMAGRHHHGEGERFAYELLSLATRVFRPDGDAMFTEKMLIAPLQHPITQPSVMHDQHVFGTLFILTPPQVSQRILARARPLCRFDQAPYAGISELPGQAGLMCRVLGSEAESVRLQLRVFWQLAREEATGHRLPSEFAWR
ncbi:MAG: urease accessory protein UreD [Curvibacter sp.]|nr:MAG: urease accessory protein UreD [Curvibacter sp.]